MCGHPDHDRPDPSRRRHLPLPLHHHRHSSQRQRSADPRHGQPQHQQQQQQASGSHSAAPAPTEPPEAPSLADLGFEVRLERQVAWGDAGTQSLYVVKEAGKLPHVARLSVVDGAATVENATTLFVSYIATEVDSRPPALRPRARDVLAAFWAGTAGRPLARLRRVYFEAVMERTTRAVVRDRVCPLMQVPYDRCTEGPRGDFALGVPLAGMDDHASASWAHLCAGSRLVRSALGMPARFPRMARPGEDLQVVRLDVHEGYDTRGNPSAFDLEVTFGHRELPAGVRGP